MNLNHKLVLIKSRPNDEIEGGYIAAVAQGTQCYEFKLNKARG